MTVRIGHLVEPSTIADYLDFVQCGFLLPVRFSRTRNRNFRHLYAAWQSSRRRPGPNLTYDFVSLSEPLPRYRLPIWQLRVFCGLSFSKKSPRRSSNP